MALTVTTDERSELERRIRSRTIRSEDARRARVILMLADGASYTAIEQALPCYRDYINRWRRRFIAKRLEGLRSRHYSQPPSVGCSRLRYLSRREISDSIAGYAPASGRGIALLLVLVTCRERLFRLVRGSCQECCLIDSQRWGLLLPQRCDFRPDFDRLKTRVRCGNGSVPVQPR